ncbi:MAG: hypothetical protein WCL44_11625 [bacterium]
MNSKLSAGRVAYGCLCAMILLPMSAAAEDRTQVPMQGTPAAAAADSPEIVVLRKEQEKLTPVDRYYIYNPDGYYRIAK